MFRDPPRLAVLPRLPARSVHPRELFTASRQVAPLLRIGGEVCCCRFPCSQLYTNIYSVVKYRLYGSVFLQTCLYRSFFPLFLKIVFRVFSILMTRNVI